MGPVGHTAISAGIGAGVWGATGSPAAGATALGVGVLIDVDHLFDYYLWYVRRKRGKVYLILHAWEYSILGLLVVGFAYYHPLLLAAALAHLGHVTTDHFHNNLTRWSYSMTYRVLIGFDAARVSPYYDPVFSYKSWLKLVPFGKRLEPWYQRRIEPWFRSRVSDLD